MDSEIVTRVDRLHAALGRVVERDFSRLPARVVKNAESVAIIQDFSGGQSEAQLSDALHSLIASVGSFHDHLKHWGRQNNVSGESIHNFFDQSTDFCIVYDLWNRDKHGGAPRDGGWSKKAPRLLSARRVMLIETGAHADSKAFLAMGNDGTPKVSGDGDARTILTGEVVDKLGNGVGEAHEFIERAIRLCEAALKQFGVAH